METKAEKNVRGVDECKAEDQSMSEFMSAGTTTIEAPIPNSPTTKPPKNPDIIQFHILVDPIFYDYFTNT